MKTANPEWKKTGSATRSGSDKLETIVVPKPDHGLFDETMGDLHYLGAAKPTGDFLRQAVVRNGTWVALLAWGPACYALKDRDEWVGWHAGQRAERQKLVVQNRRYLLLHDRGTEPNLASKALASALRALPKQWEQAFGYRPLLAETFTDIEKFRGTCYKASGWIEAGESQGFSRDALDFYVPHGNIKLLWLKELEPSARETLCSAELPAACEAGATSSAHGVLPFREAQLRSLFEALQTVPDPRSRARFRIGSVLGIAAMALLCGCRDVKAIHRFASRLSQTQRAKIGLPLKRGTKKFREIPGYLVFYNLLRDIAPQQMARVLTEWLGERSGSMPGALAMDGKFIRDTVGVLTLADHETGAPEAMAHCSKKGDGENCELKAAQSLLGQLPALDGKVVTADPLHNQQETARAIIEKGGEYLQQVKGNQGNLLKHIHKAFAGTKPRYGRTEKGHGRIEQRAIAVLPTSAMECGFVYAQSIVAVWSKILRGGKETETVRYYISSLAPKERTGAQWHRLIRGHWAGVENRNHWSRDAIWREDATRSRNPNLVGNLALLRNALLTIAAEERETYGSLPAFTEAMQRDPTLPFVLITRKLGG